MTVKAIFENGVFRPQEPVHLTERTEVEVLTPAATSPVVDDPTDWKAAEELIGFIDDAPADVAEHHNHYLAGGPPSPTSPQILPLRQLLRVSHSRTLIAKRYLWW